MKFGYTLVYVSSVPEASSEKPWGQTVAYVRGKEGSLIELCSPVNG